MSGQLIFAVNHTRREIMKIGHTTLDQQPDAEIAERIKFFAPSQIEAEQMFYDRAEAFGIEELQLAENAEKLGYVRVASYWNRH